MAEGLYTPGKDRLNVALTRRLLGRVQIDPGTRCLDIGIEEGLVSLLLERRGATVTSYDRVYSSERLDLVRKSLGARFEIVGTEVKGLTDEMFIGRGGPNPGVGTPLTRLPTELEERGEGPFDVVVFSGVLYHVYDPLAALAIVRGLVRHGGIVVVETAAVYDNELTLNLNAGARFTPLAVWLPSLAALDHMLRLVRLVPIDLEFRGRARGRIAVACRAVEEPAADPGDSWIGSPLHDYELAEYLDWSNLASQDAAEVGYAPAAGRIELFDRVQDGPSPAPDESEQRLDLSAMT